MGTTWRGQHKGYAIVQHSSFEGEGRYKASYAITKSVNGVDVEVHTGHCEGELPSEREAHAAAYHGASAYIDENLPAIA